MGVGACAFEAVRGVRDVQCATIAADWSLIGECGARITKTGVERGAKAALASCVGLMSGRGLVAPLARKRKHLERKVATRKHKNSYAFQVATLPSRDPYSHRKSEPRSDRLCERSRGWWRR